MAGGRGGRYYHPEVVDYYRENQAAAAPRPPLPVPHAAAAAGSGGVTRAGIGDICPFSRGLTRAGGAGAVR